MTVEPEARESKEIARMCVYLCMEREREREKRKEDRRGIRGSIGKRKV